MRRRKPQRSVERWKRHVTGVVRSFSRGAPPHLLKRLRYHYHRWARMRRDGMWGDSEACEFARMREVEFRIKAAHWRWREKNPSYSWVSTEGCPRLAAAADRHAVRWGERAQRSFLDGAIGRGAMMAALIMREQRCARLADRIQVVMWRRKRLGKDCERLKALRARIVGRRNYATKMIEMAMPEVSYTIEDVDTMRSEVRLRLARKRAV